jgi:galactofuranose transport system permease protein
MKARIKKFFFTNGPLLATICIFILVYFLGTQLYPAMGKPQVFLNLLINNASLLIISIGMTMVVLMNGIDLSVSGMIALTSVASAALLQNGWNPFVVMLLMLLMGTAMGLVMGTIIHYLKVESFVVTLMGLFFAEGMAYVINRSSITITNEFYKYLALTKIPIPFLENSFVYITTLVGLVLLIVMFIISRFTNFGRTIYAIGNNEQSALLMGMPVARTKLMVYSLSGFCSSLAGIVFSISLLSGFGGYAKNMNMDAIAAVVIGGTALTGGKGNVIGTLFGVLISGTIVTILQFNGSLTSWWTRIAVGILTLIFIGVQALFYRRKQQA